MKSFRFFLAGKCIIWIFLITSCNGINDYSTKTVTSHDFESLTRDFKNPPIEYSTAPFWVWNGEVTKRNIDEQLPLFKKQGISQVFIHPRPGLITEYLSDEWFELCKYSVDKGKELDMKIWLYDENSYPSGFAGGHIISVMPPSFDPVAGLKLTRLDILHPADTDKYFIVIKEINNNFANISGGTSTYVNQPGVYYAFTKWYYPKNEAWFGGFSYVDLLAYGITERFIKTTMQGYEEYFGEDLGTYVPGIFTDEPNINTRGDDLDVIRFTPVLFNKFKEKYGYQLENYLPCLYDDVGDYKNIRHDYYALLLDMFIERWAVPWYKYTEEKNLKWTGHYWEHGWPNPKHGGDNMAMYAWHQYPGIDMFFNDAQSRPDQFGNIRAVKELSSVVNQLGKERALSETYGGSGWELSFEDMKRLGDWEYVLGVNFMNQHLSYMTIKGARKRDFPQSMSYHTPWWENYKILNAYFERLSLALSYGEQDNKILILEPTSSSWMYFSPRQDRGHLGAEGIINKYRDSFHKLLNTLEKNQVEYDIGSERIIKDHGNVKDSKFIIGERAYDMVILPPHFENFEPYMFELIKKYLADSGKVLSLAGIPLHLDGNISRKIPEFIQNFPEQWIIEDSVNKNLIDKYFSDMQCNALEPETWKGRIFHQRRNFTDGQLLFITNFDPEEMGNYHFEVNGKTAVCLDPFTGDYKKYPAETKDGKLILSDQLHPSGSILLFISNKNLQAEELIRNSPTTKSLIEGSETTVQRIEPNMLTLDYCDLELEGNTYQDIYFYNAEEKIFEFYLKEIYGFNYNPWSNGIQYRKRILDKNNFEAGTGFKVDFPFFIEDDYIPSNTRVVVEWPHLYTISCNDVELKPLEDAWWLDHSFGVFIISDHLKPGKNIITVKADPMDIHAELEPVYITGDFGLRSSEKGWVIIPSQRLEVGSWKDQFMPFYSESITYLKNFKANLEDKNYIVQLNEWNGTVAKVRVNGEDAGIIGWKPYELDITNKIKDGDNNVEVVVTGSLKNLLGPHHNDPSPGVVTPWSFFYAPDHQPPGLDYHQLDYGLFEDFDIYSF
jgi:hypothetical protein